METGGCLQIEKVTNGGELVLQARGVLGLSTATELRAALTEARSAGQGMVLDVSQLTAIDLCGLQLLVAAQRTCAGSACGLRVRGASENLRKTALAAGFALSAMGFVEPEESHFLTGVSHG